MAEVRAEDDSIRRFVLLHYRYDAARNERRDVVVAAFDNEAEFLGRFHELRMRLDRERESGELRDLKEHVSGADYEPGRLARRRERRPRA